MATIAIELGKLSSKKTREVYLLVRQGKTRRRVKTGVKLLETEISPKTGKIKSVEKAMAVEKLKCELQESMDALKKGTLTTVKADANTIAAKITRKKQENATRKIEAIHEKERAEQRRRWEIERREREQQRQLQREKDAEDFIANKSKFFGLVITDEEIISPQRFSLLITSLIPVIEQYVRHKVFFLQY